MVCKLREQSTTSREVRKVNVFKKWHFLRKSYTNIFNTHARVYVCGWGFDRVREREREREMWASFLSSMLKIAIFSYFFKEGWPNCVYFVFTLHCLSILSNFRFLNYSFKNWPSWYIYAPPWGLSTLAKEFSASARIMQSSSKELSTLVADRV